MHVEQVTTDEQLMRMAPVMCQLRPQFDADGVVQQARQQMLEEGYHLAMVVDDDESVLCVAGFVIQRKLAWGKHLYVDDLVTDESMRSTGAGAMMIDWLKAFARERGCEQLHLDSGVQRFGAHRFYLRHGFDITSHHFAISKL
ncbi:GNAT family N-acetyltransferase [Saccharospirillum mangrovi]|uniref:GNAT family N-acetyltransferase n=1 Tax=Saccharospirillum mangrovi TaxID=2161747 RepID=UPI000D338178|nr:GNAT family N-acetyltransferase [Saccharospirillum mangrovi]